jgi:hypothetical protein
MNRIDIVWVYEWEALYVNGELIQQDHKIDRDNIIFRLCENQPFTFDNRHADEDWFAGPQEFPLKLEDVVFATTRKWKGLI